MPTNQKNWRVSAGDNFVTVSQTATKNYTLTNGSEYTIILSPEAAILMAAQIIQAVMGMELK